MKLFSFKGGVHPPTKKSASEHKAIELFKAPDRVYLLTQQHIGSYLEPLVKTGDMVKIGQKIAESKSEMSAPIHSPVSGKVVGIESPSFLLSETVKMIVIENDHADEWVTLDKLTDYKSKSKPELLALIKERGIVGQGGAAFPTHVKLNPPSDKTIDILLVNGAECEPYLNADNRVMIEQGEKIISGIKIAMHILGVNKAVIAIENNKQEAIAKMIELTKSEDNIDIAQVEAKYPQGGEKQLISAVLKRVVPLKKLPSEVGVIVINTQTLKSIHEGIIEGKPVIDRVVTVSGKGVKESKNYLVKIGTTFKDILDTVGYDKEKTEKLISGGPMMGIAQYTEEVPVVKGTSGIIALSYDEATPYESKNCIKCGRCVDVCPMKLVPLMFANLGEDLNWERANDYHLLDCIECGSCAYTCPANRPLAEAIKIGKAKIRALKK